LGWIPGAVTRALDNRPLNLSGDAHKNLDRRRIESGGGDALEFVPQGGAHDDAGAGRAAIWQAVR
jgi:hypothetical protein